MYRSMGYLDDFSHAARGGVVQRCIAFRSHGMTVGISAGFEQIGDHLDTALLDSEEQWRLQAMQPDKQRMLPREIGLAYQMASGKEEIHSSASARPKRRS